MLEEYFSLICQPNRNTQWPASAGFDCIFFSN